MGYKIFVSYKYHDDSVDSVNEEICSNSLSRWYKAPTKVRDYVDYLEKYIDHSYHIYKGESDGEDLSYLKDATIWKKLKEKIVDSSVTIVLISPNMKEKSRSERLQWIPWEIAYSLRETTRNDRTSHSNAILAVILPDRISQYNYFTELYYGNTLLTQFYYNNDKIFSIIRKNMNNKKGMKSCSDFLFGKGICPISCGEESYIPSVKWTDFIKNPNKYIEIAVARKEHICEYNICKEV